MLNTSQNRQLNWPEQKAMLIKQQLLLVSGMVMSEVKIRLVGLKGKMPNMEM